MEKIRKIFPDGEVILYRFCQSKTITLFTREKNLTEWECFITFYFGNTKKRYLIDNNFEKPQKHKNYYSAKMNETYKIYKQYKKQQNKTPDEKQLITALMYIIHDIKEEQRTNAKIFYYECKKQGY